MNLLYFSVKSMVMTLTGSWTCGTSGTTPTKWKRRGTQWTKRSWRSTSPWRKSRRDCWRFTSSSWAWPSPSAKTSILGTTKSSWWVFFSKCQWMKWMMNVKLFKVQSGRCRDQGGLRILLLGLASEGRQVRSRGCILAAAELLGSGWQAAVVGMRHDGQLLQINGEQASSAGPRRSGGLLPRVRSRHAQYLFGDRDPALRLPPSRTRLRRGTQPNAGELGVGRGLAEENVWPLPWRQPHSVWLACQADGFEDGQRGFVQLTADHPWNIRPAHPYAGPSWHGPDLCWHVPGDPGRVHHPQHQHASHFRPHVWLRLSILRIFGKLLWLPLVISKIKEHFIESQLLGSHHFQTLYLTLKNFTLKATLSYGLEMWLERKETSSLNLTKVSLCFWLENIWAEKT